MSTAMIIVNPAMAAELEKLGWVADRDFLVSEPIPEDWPDDTAACRKRQRED